INGVTLFLSGDYIVKSLSDADEISFIEKIKNCIDNKNERKVVNIFSSNVIGVIHNSSKNSFTQSFPGFLVDSVIIDDAKSGFDSQNEKYNLSFSFKFVLNKPYLLYDGDYPAHIQFCERMRWTESSIYHSIAYLNEAINISDGPIIDSIVLLFNKKKRLYGLFLYDSSSKRIVRVSSDYFSTLQLCFKDNGVDVYTHDVRKIQSGGAFFSDADSVLGFINEKSKGVYFRLVCPLGSYNTGDARAVRFLFCRDFGDVSINSYFKINNEDKNCNETQWVEEKKKLDSYSVEYISNDGAFTISFEKSKVDDYRDKKITFDIIGFVDSVEVFKYSCEC
ncbi:hypothetical protein Q4S25_20860, partial [Morganella morganii]